MSTPNFNEPVNYNVSVCVCVVNLRFTIISGSTYAKPLHQILYKLNRLIQEIKLLTLVHMIT